jgi:ATP adenylyltransferase
MDHLWTPWRSTYITRINSNEEVACIFCHAAASTDDEATLVVYRAHLNFVILNKYPYTNGHLMIAPYRHVSRLQALDEAVTAEMMRLTRLAEAVLEAVYKPHGLNVGLNLGEAAGAGIEQHLHLHALPRWKGDANFMTSIANTRVVPELLSETYGKLRVGFAAALANINLQDGV